jgi:putative ABC transport system ATP-binding protein
MVNIVEIEGLSKSYEKGIVKALNGVDLTVEQGEFVAITGPSGSGKSTLLNMIGALDRADEGKIIVDGHDLLSEKDLSSFVRRQLVLFFNCIIFFLFYLLLRMLNFLLMN